MTVIVLAAVPVGELDQHGPAIEMQLELELPMWVLNVKGDADEERGQRSGCIESSVEPGPRPLEGGRALKQGEETKIEGGGRRRQSLINRPLSRGRDL